MNINKIYFIYSNRYHKQQACISNWTAETISNDLFASLKKRVDI